MINARLTAFNGRSTRKALFEKERPGIRRAKMGMTAKASRACNPPRYCRGVSVGGTITGKGADFIILDDVMKADEAQSQVAREQVIRWFTGTILTRFNNAERGALISMQQRVHEDDLPAHLIAQGYRCLNLPAIADRDQHIAVGPKQTYHFKRGEPLDPVRFPIDTLERLRLELGPHMYAAQYLQNPVSPEGNLVHMEHFRRYEGTIPREYFEKVVQSWDTAQSELPTADYSVGTTWGYVEGHRGGTGSTYLPTLPGTRIGPRIRVRTH